MRIIVSSQNFRTITGHAGKSRRFLVFEENGEGQMDETGRLDLPRELSLHEYHGSDAEHPLFQAQPTALITQSAGPRFQQRLARQGVTVHVTSATDPLQAAQAVLRGEPLPEPEEDPHHAHHPQHHRHHHHHG
ncbi:nitrogen fixation protein [Ectothiorhodospira haloalkaliphila]|uniref:NifB/NifX family molybdenum-iron cluster-binding protein n=1 Tax=Ectothiorhodospira haloalkaliphila TaxID=421628 RepID=UPI001EE7F9FD|nr:NifB/NifX family molybdenum-iron cluster-binding protein [Ectothiorhodospira haloalkaliphila]MCG5524195.1 nitrogen fixation protein [Ectothiorhodospira haloalkaliphila]